MASVKFLLDVATVLSTVQNNTPSEDAYSFHGRESWNATAPILTSPLATPVQYVIIHHTYIPAACYTTDQCSSSMKSMQNYHISLGWGDIGYNFCVGGDGGVYEGRGWETKGIHAGNANSVSVGVCLIGDWREELPPQQQLTTTKELIQVGVDRGFIRSDYRLIGHDQAMATECPGIALAREIEHWDHYFPGKIEFGKNF